MLSFSLAAEALTGLIYHRPSGENSNFQFNAKAEIHVLNDEVIRRVNEHTHNGNSATVEASKIRSQMKKRDRETEEPPQQIISVAVGLINDQASAAIPAVHHIRRDLRRQRQRKGNPLPCPQDTRFDIPDEYQLGDN